MSKVGIYTLDVVVSDNKVTFTGKLILCWSCVEVNIIYKQKILCIFHLLKMLYSSKLSPCESSGKILECTSFSGDTIHLSTSPHDIYKLVEKTTIPLLVLRWEYFTYSRVGETAWWGLSEAIKIPCEMQMALSVISDISARCYITEWSRKEIAWILLSERHAIWMIMVSVRANVTLTMSLLSSGHCTNQLCTAIGEYN